MGVEKKKGADFRSHAPNLQHVKDTINPTNNDIFPIDIFTHSIQKMIINANKTIGYNYDDAVAKYIENEFTNSQGEYY